MAENELAVANWAFEHNQQAGRGTDTLPDTSMHYQPLKTTRGVIGVLGIKPIGTNAYLESGSATDLGRFCQSGGFGN